MKAKKMKLSELKKMGFSLPDTGEDSDVLVCECIGTPDLLTVIKSVLPTLDPVERLVVMFEISEYCKGVMKEMDDSGELKAVKREMASVVLEKALRELAENPPTTNKTKEEMN